MTSNEKLGIAAIVFWFLWKKSNSNTVTLINTDPVTGKETSVIYSTLPTNPAMPCSNTNQASNCIPGTPFPM